MPLVNQMCADSNAWRSRHILNYYYAVILAIMGLTAAGLAQLAVALNWRRGNTLMFQTIGTLSLAILAAFPLGTRAEVWWRLYISTESLVYEIKFNTYDEKGFQAILTKYNAIRQESSEEPPGQNVGTAIASLLTQTPVSTALPTPTATVTPTPTATAVPGTSTPQ